MSEEIKNKIPLRDKRKHLSDKYIKSLSFEDKTYSVGDDTVIYLLKILIMLMKIDE